MDYQETDYDYGQQEQNPKNSSVMGLKILLIVLLVLLAAVCTLYYRSVQISKVDEEALRVEVDTLQNQTKRLMGDMDVIKFDNDTLNRNLQNERHKADSLMTRLKKERSISYSKLQQYQKELGTLRSAMQGFVRQIDSLNTLNKKLVGENLKFKTEIRGLKAKTEAAEETAQELNMKVQRGSQIKARNITLKGIKKNNKDAVRAREAVGLVVSLILTANELANYGERTVYVRITTPDGYILQENQGATFDFEGQNIPYTCSRQVDYQGEDFPVSVYYNGTGLTSGKYTVLVYMDGLMVGSSEVILK